jgi:phosphatidylglycerophosphate synthase
MTTEYTYISPDGSYFYNKIMSPFCNKIVTYIPNFIHPNILTLTGVICSYISMYLVKTENKKYGPLAGLLWILYIILDNLDGKQARRTGTSSKFGELLDHVCDSYSTIYAYFIFIVIFKIPEYIHLISFNILVSVFYLDHWQSYFSKKLVTGNKYFGTDEVGIVIGILITLWSFNIIIDWKIPFVISLLQLLLFIKDHVLEHINKNDSIKIMYNFIFYILFINFWVIFFKSKIINLSLIFPHIITDLILKKQNKII